jgi:uncharacterized protein (TIGR02453 family)
MSARRTERTHPLDDDQFPPFEGFPEEGIRFLQRLKRNNTRAWFQAHQREYEECVRFPMQCLIQGLRRDLGAEIPEIEFSPKTSIFRIYRDTRFSKDKTPYKTNIAASFRLRGTRGPTENPGLYVGIEPGEIFIGGGLYMPSGDQLKKIRKAIVDDPGEFLAIVTGRPFRSTFGGILGETLARAPLGYPPDHPLIEHLRHKQFYVGIESGHEPALRPAFQGTVARAFRRSMPFIRWLAAAVA